MNFSKITLEIEFNKESSSNSSDSDSLESQEEGDSNNERQTANVPAQLDNKPSRISDHISQREQELHPDDHLQQNKLFEEFKRSHKF